MTGTYMERFMFSLGVSGTAMTIVFGMLLALMLIIKLQSFLINGSTKKKRVAKQVGKDRDAILTEVAQGAEVIDLNSDCELVAAIMAALAAHTGKSAGQLNIRSIKRVNNSNWRNSSN